VPEYTRPATWEDLKRLATLLNEAHADYALVGGYAIAAHGFSRQSEDIGEAIGQRFDQSCRLSQILIGLGARRAPQLRHDELVSREAFRNLETGLSQHVDEGRQPGKRKLLAACNIDVLGRVSQRPHAKCVEQRAVRV
jgi:hypothetical protein